MNGASISIIVPVLNDLSALQSLLPLLQPLRRQGHELVVVDGGSMDGSVSYAGSRVDRLLMTGTGRGRQMNLGAENARHDILLFLHADSVFPATGITAIQSALANPDRHWGRFDVQLDARGAAYAVISRMMNLRSRVSGVATGDQGIFVRKSLFADVGGFAAIPLMEDIALSKTLRRRVWPVCLKLKIITSARRWQQQGVMKTVLQMWTLRLAYFLGADPQALARNYYPGQDHDRG